MLRGSQTPRVRWSPPRVSTLGAEAVDLCATAGLFLDPWQQLVMDEMLAFRADGKFSAFEVAAVIPRQSGKGACLEARALSGLFLLDERLILFSAHQFKTAREHFRRIVGLIDQTPELKARVKSVRTSHGEEGIELKTGQRLQFVARANGRSGRGFSGDCVILDEAQDLDTEDLAALLPTLATRDNPQVIYTGTVSESASQLRNLRDRALLGTDKSLTYLEWSASEDDDPALPETWAKANPALGYRITEEFISREYAAMSHDLAMFSQERLSVWPKSANMGVFSEAVWDACEDPASQLLDPVCFGIDVSPDRRFASIAVAGLRPDGHRHVETVEHKKGTGWVAERVAELVAKWSPAAVVMDAAGPAGSLVADLQNVRVDVTVTSAREYAQACGGFFDAVESQTLHHLGDDLLKASVLGVKRRPLGDAWAWARKSATEVDISPLVAATLAHWATRSVSSPAPQILDPWSVE